MGTGFFIISKPFRSIRWFVRFPLYAVAAVSMLSVVLGMYRNYSKPLYNINSIGPFSDGKTPCSLITLCFTSFAAENIAYNSLSHLTWALSLAILCYHMHLGHL